jgi:RES domain-containing protein
LTLDLWRISGHNSLSGEGGLRYSARWHSAGRRIVYFAESPAGALIEVLVHAELNQKNWPRFYDLMQVAAPDSVQIELLTVPTRGEDWRVSPRVTRGLGDEWLRSKRTALARVPSAILPSTWNLLLNPEHPEADQLAILKVTRADYDSRLFTKD